MFWEVENCMIPMHRLVLAPCSLFFSLFLFKRGEVGPVGVGEETARPNQQGVCNAVRTRGQGCCCQKKKDGDPHTHRRIHDLIAKIMLDQLEQVEGANFQIFGNFWSPKFRKQLPKSSVQKDQEAAWCFASHAICHCLSNCRCHARKEAKKVETGMPAKFRMRLHILFLPM